MELNHFDLLQKEDSLKLMKFNGTHRKYFYLHLKESE
jgi:transposase-like protein